MKTRSLKSQFRLLTLLLVAVPSLLIMAIYTVGQITVVKQKNLELISHRVYSQQGLIDYWLAERAADVRELSLTRAFRNLDEEQMKVALSSKQQSNSNFDSLSYIDSDGTFKISTLSTGIQFSSAAGRPYFTAAQAGREFISDVVIGRNSGQQIINFSSPIYGYSGNFQGLILGSIRTATLEILLRENWIGKTGEVFLVNQEGLMLTEPRHLNVLIGKGLVENTAKMKFKITEDALRNIRLGEAGTATWVDYRGNKVLGAYLEVPEQGWTIIGKIDEAEVLTPIYNQLELMAGGTIILVLLFIPFATIVTNRIKRPIDWLIEQSNLVATENYEMVGQKKRIEKMPNEIDILCKTFVQMSRKIENTVTLLKENEAKLESKVLELEAANQELESFSYSVSHDLRAPLRSIDGFSQALLEDYGDKVGEKGADYLHRIRSGAQRMGSLIDDLIKLSRVSRSEMRMEVVDISSMVIRIVEDYHKAHPERPIEVIIQPHLTVMADRSLLRVMLTNLIDNSWKYTGKAVAPRIEFGLTQVNSKPVFFLRDNGVGFDMTYADKLFTPFQRLHSVVEFSGTGIGLATVLRIINRHGGKVWAEATPNKGATFYFAFEK